MAQEEKSSNKTILNVLLNKKKTTEKKTAAKLAKDEEAKAKVQELLKNTPVAALVGAKKSESIESESKLDIETHKEERTKKWLEEQVNELNRQVEEYENEILYYKQEINNLNEIINGGKFDGGVVQQNNPVDTSMNHNLVALYKHFENVYQRGFTDAKLAHPESGNGILDLFLQHFPQLQAHRTYRYRGPTPPMM